MTTWRKELQRERLSHSDGPLVANTLSEDELDVEFDAGYGGANGKPFTAWSAARVYFPVVYDGSEWVGSAPRNPCDEATGHQAAE